MRLLFEQARVKAVSSLERMAEADLKQINDDSIREWLKENRFNLSGDVRKSKHIWLDSFKELDGSIQDKNCAVTTLAKAADIYFSRNDCADVDNIGVLAAELLIHESVHHLGIEDEHTADKVATAVFHVWHSLGYSADSHWMGISTVNAPNNSTDGAVWTGERMVVWGDSFKSLKEYNPSNNHWRALPSYYAPRPGANYVSGYVDGKLICWGGLLNSQGWVYDFEKEIWSEIENRYAPSQRQNAYAVSMGDKFFVWGGLKVEMLNGQAYSERMTDGGVFDVKSNQWVTIHASPDISPRYESSIVWTGSKVIIWGGYVEKENGEMVITNTGIIFDPKTMTWTSLPMDGDPSPRHYHTALWTGTQMIIWGGENDPRATYSGLKDGGVFDFESFSWKSITAPQFSVGNRFQQAVWTGHLMLVWGGQDTTNASSSTIGKDSMSFFDPSNNIWSKKDRLMGPESHMDTLSFWTGAEMIVWGPKGGGVFYP